MMVDAFSKLDKIYHIVEVSEGVYIVPPCIFFIDEAHAVPSRMMEGGLLNAMEANDGWLTFSKGSGQNARIIRVDCSHVCWAGASTEEGRLFPPFAQRLPTKLLWHAASPKEIAQIIKLHFPHFTAESCDAVAKYARIPRQAKNFAMHMEMHQRQWKCDCNEAALAIARESGIDEYGMTMRQVKILTALGQRPISKATLAGIIDCNLEALEGVELPFLKGYADGGPFVVSCGGRGLAITRAGLKQLDLRGITHKGDKVTAEHFEDRK
jgi:Holliday junction resolvasome RuvABC ATP-dependent DNA helicase subunit